MLTATAVCRRASSIKIRISINNIWGSWLFRSRSRCVILYRFMSSRSRLPPRSLINAPNGVLEGKGRSLLWELKLRPTVDLRGRHRSSRRKMEPMAYSKSCDGRTFPQTRVLVRVASTREQYGNNLGRKTAQMIPSDPKSLVPYRQCSACRNLRLPMLQMRSIVDTALEISRQMQ